MIRTLPDDDAVQQRNERNKNMCEAVRALVSHTNCRTKIKWNDGNNNNICELLDCCLMLCERRRLLLYFVCHFFDYVLFVWFTCVRVRSRPDEIERNRKKLVTNDANYVGNYGEKMCEPFFWFGFPFLNSKQFLRHGLCRCRCRLLEFFFFLFIAYSLFLSLPFLSMVDGYWNLLLLTSSIVAIVFHFMERNVGHCLSAWIS